VIRQFAAGWNDPAKGKELAKAQYSQGADIVFQIAGGTGQGVFEAALEDGKYAIGVDSDQALIIESANPDQAARILTSMMKNVDNSIFRGLQMHLDGTTPYGTAESLGIAEGGVGSGAQQVLRRQHPDEVKAAGGRGRTESDQRRDYGGDGVLRERSRNQSPNLHSPISHVRQQEPHPCCARRNAADQQDLPQRRGRQQRGGFCVEKGEIHALVGENGAGKSTLMKILYGLEQPTHGEICWTAAGQDRQNPQRAIELGIGMVHQNFMLVPSFTIAENIVLGSEPRKGRFIDRTGRRLPSPRS
jgi:hypothetical protein